MGLLSLLDEVLQFTTPSEQRSLSAPVVRNRTSGGVGKGEVLTRPSHLVLTWSQIDGANGQSE